MATPMLSDITALKQAHATCSHLLQEWHSKERLPPAGMSQVMHLERSGISNDSDGGKPKAEAKDIFSNEDKDIFGSTHHILIIKQEAKLFANPTDISGDCHYNADLVKLESNIDRDEELASGQYYS